MYIRIQFIQSARAYVLISFWICFGIFRAQWQMAEALSNKMKWVCFVQNCRATLISQFSSVSQNDKYHLLVRRWCHCCCYCMLYTTYENWSPILESLFLFLVCFVFALLVHIQSLCVYVWEKETLSPKFVPNAHQYDRMRAFSRARCHRYMCTMYMHIKINIYDMQRDIKPFPHFISNKNQN